MKKDNEFLFGLGLKSIRLPSLKPGDINLRGWAYSHRQITMFEVVGLSNTIKHEMQTHGVCGITMHLYKVEWQACGFF